MSQEENNAVILERINLNPELALFRIRPNNNLVPKFQAGQFAELAICGNDINPPKKLLRRSYSIASAPSEKNFLEFYIVLVEDGKLTPKLWELGSGDSIWLGPKIKGKFTVDKLPDNQNYILVSTGTGLAPFISMLKEQRSQNSSLKNKWQNLVILHGVRKQKDLAYKEYLEETQKTMENFHYVPICSREEETNSSWQGLKGRVSKVLEPNFFKKLTSLELNPKNTQVLLCGNPQMIESETEKLKALGFNKRSKESPGNLHFERYW